MFGFSLTELLLTLIVALIFIKPQDLPEIAHFFGKIFYRGKRLFNELKQSLKEMEKELGVDNLRHELNRGIAEEKSKLEDEMTVIVDIYGNEHQVPNVKKLRTDLAEEELVEEVKKLNEKNLMSSGLR
jgi:Sec-independent protein translocase protein TatA